LAALSRKEADLPAQLAANSCVTSETPARERPLFACHGSRAAGCGIPRAAALPAEADWLDVDLWCDDPELIFATARRDRRIGAAAKWPAIARKVRESGQNGPALSELHLIGRFQPSHGG